MSQPSDVKIEISADDWEKELLADAKLTPAELDASLGWTNSHDFATPSDAPTPAGSDYSTSYYSPASAPYDAPTPNTSNWDSSPAGLGGVNEGALTSVYSTPYSALYSTPSEYPATPEYGTSDAFSHLGYGFDHAPSNSTSGHSTPDVSDYIFSPSPSIYSGTPGPSTPGPYPAFGDHSFNSTPTPGFPTLLPHPRPLRSQTNTSYLEPSLGPTTRRRSLSTSATDLYATGEGLPQPTNPTFIRLQAPRSQSVKPSKRRVAKHARSTSRTSNTTSSSGQDQGHLRLHSDITSILFFTGGMVPTRLGDPLESEDEGAGVQSWTRQWKDMYMNAGVGVPADAGVEFRRMMEPKEMERSQRVIEIGAMSVKNGKEKGKGEGGEGGKEIVKEKFEAVKEFLMGEGGYGEDKEVFEAYPGTAVGVASLGIQVCQGLLKYYNDWKSHGDDIREVYTAIFDLNKTFQLLNNKVPDLFRTPFVVRANECLRACQDNVQLLEARLQKLHMKTPNGIKQKIQAGGLRAFYPFRKSTLDKLKVIVQSLMHQLGLAVQLIILDSSDSTRSTALLIKEEVDSISSLSTQIDALTISTHTQAADTTASVQTLISSEAMTAANVQTLLSTEDVKKLIEILKWLDAPDRSIEHEAARRKHQKGTEEWLLQGKHYQDWVSGSSPLLWLHGKAGCCKTVLSSTVIQDLERRVENQPGTALAFFYFTFSDAKKQSYKDLILSMVTELSRGRPIIARLLEMYKASVPHKPSIESLEETLITTIKRSDVSYLVADALDECSEEQRDEVTQGFKRITHACPSTRVLITSRRESDIEDLMQDWCGVQLAVDEKCVNADIDIFVKDALATDKKLMRLSEFTKSEIQRVFHEKSDGM
ncbi:hypothetical protein G6514_006411 [Epicoccum nigrum]|nr:hypothetical protein G6514_006411 [Epicoccum nigrum]